MELDPTYERLNNPFSQLQSTCAISEKPEIGFAGGGAGGGTRDGDDCIAGGAAAAAGGAAAGSCASLSFRLLANWFMICVAVAWMMPTPRPYCATAPESVRLVCTSTFDPLPAGSR